MTFSRYLEIKKKTFNFSKSALTLYAEFFMLLDHIALMLIKNGKLYGYDIKLYNNAINLPEASTWLILYKTLRMIGRLSFPIFALLIVEGFRHTSNLIKYMIKILVLAIVSEIPFDLLVYNRVICFDGQNVLFSYFLGLLLLLIYKKTYTIHIFFHLIITIFFAIIAYIFRLDYAIETMLLMFVYYKFRHDINIKCILTMIIMFLSSLQNYYGFGIFSVFFIYFYNEQLGYPLFKKFQYLFYPLHMLFLYGLVYFSYYK